MDNHLSVSQIKTFQTCPRKYWYSNVARLCKKEDAFPLRKGKAVHEAVGLIVKDGDWRAYIQETFAAPEAQFERHERLQIEAILRTYEAEKRPYSVVATEVDFKQRLWKYGRPFVGYIDMIVESEGRRGLLELKVRTRKQPIMSLWEDMQLAIYMAATGLNFGIYETILHSNLAIEMGESEEEFELRKSTMAQPARAKRKMPETDEEYIERISKTVSVQRFVIEREDSVLYERVSEARDWAKLMRRGTKRANYPQISSACFGRFANRACPFYELCTSQDAPHILESMYKRRDSAVSEEVDEELSA